MPLDPKELQAILDELEASRASRKTAWAILQDLRRVPHDLAGIDLPPPAVKNISVEGRIVRGGTRKALASRQSALKDLANAIKAFRKSQDHQTVHALNKALERAEELSQ